MSSVQNGSNTSSLGMVLLKGVLGFFLLVVMLLSYYFYDTKKDHLNYLAGDPDIEIQECSAQVVLQPEGYVDSDYGNVTGEDSKVVLVTYQLSNPSNGLIKLYKDTFHYFSWNCGSVDDLKEETEGVIFDDYSNLVLIPAGETTMYSEYVRVPKDITELTCKYYSNSEGMLSMDVTITE